MRKHKYVLGNIDIEVAWEMVIWQMLKESEYVPQHSVLHKFGILKEYIFTQWDI